MKYLKLTQPLYVGYTGTVARYNFVNGVSVEPIPEVERVRIAGNIKCVEVDAEGNEGGDPSPAASVVANQRTRAELRSLPRQSEAEKADENARAVMGSDKLRPLYSAAALDKMATKAGIAGLRDVAGPWNVKSKSIPVLMQMIIDAQAAYITAQTEALKTKGVPVEEIAKLLAFQDEAVVEPAPAMAPVVEPVIERAKKAPKLKKTEPAPEATKPEVDAVAAAAMSGDLAAALNAESTEAVEGQTEETVTDPAPVGEAVVENGDDVQEPEDAQGEDSDAERTE